MHTKKLLSCFKGMIKNHTGCSMDGIEGILLITINQIKLFH